MASSSQTQLPSTEEQFDDEKFKPHLEELEKAKTDQELDEKLSGMSKIGLSISGWMKYVFNRDTSREEFNAVWLTIDEYIASAEAGLQAAWRVVASPNWRVEKKGSKGDIVESTQTQRFGKVYRFTGIVDCPAKFLYEEFKNNITRLPEWNPTILKSDLIKQIADGIDLSYQVTAGGGRGIIAPRDFVILRRCAPVNSEGQVIPEGQADPHCYMCSGTSVDVPGYPPHRDMVRGHNKVGCWCLKPTMVKTSSGKLEEKTVFQWLMCCDLKGKIPQFVLDTAFATVMLDYIVHVRKHVADAKAKGLVK